MNLAAPRLSIQLTALQQRLLALALACVPVIVSIIVLSVAIESCVEHYERMATLETERLAFTTLTAGTPRRMAAIAAIHASGLETDFFADTSASATAQKVQHAVREALKSAGVSGAVDTVHAQADADSPVLAITDHVTLTADIATLAKILYACEHTHPRLFVGRLNIRDSAGENRALGPHRLAIDFDISGYMRPQP